MLFARLNAGRSQRLAEEMALMHELPERRIESAKRERVRVDSGSLIYVDRNTYSVPSRLIGEQRLQASRCRARRWPGAKCTPARARRAIQDMLNFLPQIASVMRDGQIVDVSTQTILPGEIVIIRPGSRIPVDGQVVSGHSFIVGLWVISHDSDEPPIPHLQDRRLT